MKLNKHLLILSLVLLGFLSCSDDEIEVVSKVSFEKTSISVSEGDGKLIVPLTLSSPLTSASTVWISIVEGSEVGGREVLNYRVPGSIWLGKDAVRGRYEITIIDDPYPNENRSFEIEITDVWGGAIKDDVNQRCTVTIEDDDSKDNVIVGFEKSKTEVNEDVGIYELPVVIDGILSDSLTFRVKSENGSAVDGVHFEILEPQNKMFQGEKWAIVPIKIFDKQAIEEDRSFNVIIEQALGATPQDTTVQISKVTHTCEVNILKVIRQVRFPELEVIVDERTKPFEYPVALTAAVPHDVVVRLVAKPNSTAIEGVHYEIDKTELTIKKGEVEAYAVISPIDDQLGNPDRFVDFDIEVLTEGVNLSEEFKTSRLIIENDDTSIGFKSSSAPVWMYGTANIPIQLKGLRGERYLVEVKAKENALVQENVHYMILTKTVEFGENDSVVNVRVATLNSDLDSFDLPLEIASVKGLSLGANAVIDKSKKDLTLNVLSSPVPIDNKSNWSEVSCTSKQAGSGPEKMWDGDPNSNWHSEWWPTRPPGPHIIVIDMDADIVVAEVLIELHRYTKTIDVWIGDDYTVDSDKWISLGRMTFTGGKQTMSLKPKGMVSGRYMKISVKGDGTNFEPAVVQEIHVNGKINN